MPLGQGQFIFIDMDSVIPIQVTVKAHEHIAVHAPGLALIVADVFHPQAHFLHDLTVDRLLQRLANLGIPCQQGIAGIAAAGIFA